MSPRPGRIVGEVAVPFAYPRPAQLRFAPEFGRLAGEVSALLRASGRLRSHAATGAVIVRSRPALRSADAEASAGDVAWLSRPLAAAGR